jgi:hypothetical protein
MADLKISALTGATTPLAGTEVLPIVQSGATVKVSVDNLTAGKTVAVDKLAVNGVGTPYGEIDLLNPSAGMNRAMMFTVPVAGGANNGMQIGLRREGNSEVISSIKMAFNDLSGGLGNYISINTGLTDLETLKCDSAQNVTVTAGNLIVGTSGKGIDFSATAGTGTSELLADYEEGTWTPTVDGSTTVGVATYDAQFASYTKVGNRVIFSAYIAWSAHTGTGNMRISGLPFTIANSSTNYSAVAVYLDASTALSALNVLQVRTIINSTGLFPTQTPVGGGATSQVALPASGGFMLSGQYYV